MKGLEKEKSKRKPPFSFSFEERESHKVDCFSGGRSEEVFAMTRVVTVIPTAPSWVWQGKESSSFLNKADCFSGDCCEELIAMTHSPFGPSRFRFFTSSTGRFLKPDNVVPDLTNPQNWNLYSYVKGNPINFNDPSGHMPIGGWGPVGSESNKAFPDNGEPPFLGGWADNIGQTVSNIKYELIKAGFSKEAVDRAAKEGNLKPAVKVYVVHGEDKDKKGGHVAISATLGGESIWWSHGGSVPLYGRMSANESETTFLNYYRSEAEVTKIDVFTLKLTLDESIGVAREINRRVQYPQPGTKAPAMAKYLYEYRELIGYVCSTSTADILFQAGVSSVSNPIVIWPNISGMYFETISEKKETYYPIQEK